ncbi:MAG: B12-binding domain-containing radical SAM protein [Methanomassiliicoccales archaeon]|nr:MAG: B12-binding domain-containing radical SAM protein [Methanomassiliicoccales archaeon]
MSLKILLVQPTTEVLSGDNLAPPLWPSILASLTPNEHEVDFLHCGHERPTRKKLAKYDVVGISALTSNANDAYRIGDMARDAGVKCVIGGIHAYVMPKEAKGHCDSVMLGEAEYIWSKILSDIQKNALSPFYRGAVTEPEDFPIPDLSIYRKYRFFTTKLAEIVRGCPHNCRFCGATMYSGRRYRYKNVDNLVAEIENWNSKRRIAHFTNTNLIASPRKTNEIMKRISDFNLRWWSPCSVDILHHEDVLAKVADAGCMVLQFGFDSISKETLKSMNKSFNTKSDYRLLIKKCHDLGIEVGGSFIFGWDTDTKDVFKNTVEFACDADIDIPAYLPLTPFPGTDIFNCFSAQGRITTTDWSNYNWHHCVFEPKNMTGEELLSGCYHAFEESYSTRSIFHRFYSRPRGSKEMALLLMFSVLGRSIISFSRPYWNGQETFAQRVTRHIPAHASSFKHRA